MPENQVLHRTHCSQYFLATIVLTFALILSFDAYANHDISRDGNGEVIGGFDPVAYFTMGEALQGSRDISTEYLGGTWLFVNEQHRKLFLSDPGAYIPQYGGYCSVSSSFDRHGGANPRAWQIVDGKLYLFYDKRTSDGWEVHYSSTRAADEKWTKAKAGLLQQ
jgi:YHS domain-containing protein